MLPPRVIALMHPWPCPRRRAVVLVVAVVVLTVATACSSETNSPSSARQLRPAATVVGTEVPIADVTADLRAEAVAGKKGKVKTDPSSPLASPKGKRPGTYTPAATAAALTNRILYQLYGQQLRSLKTKIAAQDKERARQSLCADASTGQVPSGTSCPPLAVYPSAYRSFQLSLRERELAFGKILYGRVFDAVRRTEPTLLREVCVDLVQVASQAVSNQVQKAMKAGASITEASKSAATAGQASAVQPACLYLAVAPPALTKAKRGTVVPIKGQSALGIAKVTSFKTATKADFATQPPASVASVQKLIKGEVDRSIRKAKITVNTKYGHWNPAQLVVVAPKAKTATTSTTGSGHSTTTSTTSSSTTSTAAP